jgi:hypothetical protein
MIRRGWLVVAVLVVAGVVPTPSGADKPVPPISLADDFRGAVGPVWQLQRIRPEAITVVRDPTGLDRDVVAITLRSGDMADSAGVSERAELSEAGHLHLPTGTDVWYGFSLYLPSDSRSSTDGSSWVSGSRAAATARPTTARASPTATGTGCSRSPSRTLTAGWCCSRRRPNSEVAGTISCTTSS